MSEIRLETEAGTEGRPLARAGAASLRIIAAAIILGFLYYASSLVITLIFAIFIAFVLDPGVKLMERLHIPRWVGSLLMVLWALLAVYLLIYVIYDRAQAFIAQLPAFAAAMQSLVTHLETWLRGFWPTTFSSAPPESSVPTVRVQQGGSWLQYLAGFGPVYSFTVTVMFIPFLVFFMLTSRDHIWEATLNLFPVRHRQEAEDIIGRISEMVRRYVLGNLLVVLISAAIITPVFMLIHLPYAALVGPVAAFLSMIPYVGIALSLLPPMLIGLVQYHNLEPFITICVTLTVVHFLAVNVLTPKFVGHSVKLNPLSVTIAMLFWAWLWGAPGLILAVPITAAIKAVCDNVGPLKAYGRWLGDESG